MCPKFDKLVNDAGLADQHGNLVLMLDPEGINFTQDNIARTFRAPHKRSLHETVQMILDGVLDPEDFPPIRVGVREARRDDGDSCLKWFSFDNRRLAVFRVCRLAGKDFKIPVIVLPLDKYPRAPTSPNGGSVVVIRDTSPQEYIGGSICRTSFKCPQLQMTCYLCNQKMELLNPRRRLARICMTDTIGHCHFKCFLRSVDDEISEDDFLRYSPRVIINYLDVKHADADVVDEFCACCCDFGFGYEWPAPGKFNCFDDLARFQRDYKKMKEDGLLDGLIPAKELDEYFHRFSTSKSVKGVSIVMP